MAERPAFNAFSPATAASSVRPPSPGAVAPARDGAAAEPLAARGRAALLAQIARVGATPRPAGRGRRPAQSSAASMRQVKRIEPLAESIVPNAAFERSLSAASSSSGAPSGQDLFPYSPSTLSFQAPADLRAFSSTASPEKVGRPGLTVMLGSADPRGREDAATVKTSLVVPAFHKSLTLNFSGGYNRLHRPETTILPYYPYDASSAVDGGRADITAGDPASPVAPVARAAGTESYSYGAGAAVPVTHDLHLGIGYTAQRLSGSYGVAPNALPVNRKDAYSGSLTFAPRGGKSTLSIIGGQSRYSDDAAPSAPYTERRGDVMFSVKF